MPDFSVTYGAKMAIGRAYVLHLRGKTLIYYGGVMRLTLGIKSTILRHTHDFFGAALTDTDIAALFERSIQGESLMTREELEESAYAAIMDGLPDDDCAMSWGYMAIVVNIDGAKSVVYSESEYGQRIFLVFDTPELAQEYFDEIVLCDDWPA